AAAAGVAAVPAFVVAVSGRAKILAARRLRTAVPEAFAAYAPEFVLYTSRPDDASYQVTMWLPYLQRAGRRFCILTRNAVPAEALAGLTDVPVIEARRISDLDALVPPSLKAAFYVNASSGNGAFVRYQHLTHIYLGHGDSDKPPSYNPTHAMYDRVFAAGPAAVRRYAAHGVKIPLEKFQIVGRPQVEQVRPATRPLAEVAAPVVLYAPTWRGHVEETMLYSLPVGEQIVTALLRRGATVIFRPHPFSDDFDDDAATVTRIRGLLADDAARTGRNHVFGADAERDRTLLDCINSADAMVSDVSAVVSDWLFSGKPFAMIAVPTEPELFVRDYPVARASYVVRGDLSDLEPALTAMLGPDPMAGSRLAIRADYLGDFPVATYAEVFVDAVRQVSAKAADDLEVEEPDTAAPAEISPEELGGEPSSTSAGSIAGSRWAGYRETLTQPALQLAAPVVALLALAAALLTASRWVPVVAALIALGLAVWSAARNLRDRSRWTRLLTLAAAARGILLLTLLVAAPPASRSLWLVTATALVAVTLVAEGHIRSAWGRVGLDVHDFPEVNAHVRERLPRGAVTLAGFLWLALAYVLVALDVPGWLLLALAAPVAILGVDVLVRALVRARRVLAAEDRLVPALTAYAPQFAVYFASTVGAAYQVGMWLPYFERIGRPYVIITRTVPMLEEIARTTAAAGVRVPIIFRPTLRSVEEVIVPSLRAAFYVNNAVRNTHFIERRELVHVWLNHGDSEKPACYNPVHAIYDVIFAAGQAGIDRYARHGVTIPREKFRIVGRPQVESIQPVRGPIGSIRPPTVLYAPTWQGPFADTRVYSLPQGRRIVDHLLQRGARVVFRAHPFNYRYRECVALIEDIGRLLADDRARTGRQHLWGSAAEQEMSIEDCFNASDAMISDVSAVVSDYLQADKPFSIVAVGRTPEQLLVDVPAAAAAYVLAEDLSNLGAVADALLGPDPLAPVRRATRVYYLGDFGDRPYAEGFLSAAREVIDSGAVDPSEHHAEHHGRGQPAGDDPDTEVKPRSAGSGTEADGPVDGLTQSADLGGTAGRVRR
ncbi:MAG: CDP-glycerol glycerophosphotransferase family protein, partial [Actinomycetes bacterium]